MRPTGGLESPRKRRLDTGESKWYSQVVVRVLPEWEDGRVERGGRRRLVTKSLKPLSSGREFAFWVLEKALRSQLNHLGIHIRGEPSDVGFY